MNYTDSFRDSVTPWLVFIICLITDSNTTVSNGLGNIREGGEARTSLHRGVRNLI